jgi:hypothetical protein
MILQKRCNKNMKYVYHCIILLLCLVYYFFETISISWEISFTGFGLFWILDASGYQTLPRTFLIN